MTHFRIMFALILCLGLAGIAQSQTTGKKKFVKPGTEEVKKEEPKKETGSGGAKSDEVSKFGYGVNIGNLYFQTYSFQIGLDPNVAYRLADNFAVGFMLKLNYYYEKLTPYGISAKYSGWDFGPTVFTRWKPLMKVENATPFMQGIFVQAEYERAFISRPTDEFGNISIEGDKVIPFKDKENYLYIGAGFASGYPFSSFISFHYNVIDDIELSRAPFTYRIGFTWNY